MQIDYKRHVLKNGLTLYTYVDVNKHSTIVNLVTKFGGGNHDFYLDGELISVEDGMAHFMEHLLIETGPYGNLMEYFGERQMSSNGTTFYHKTEYYFTASEHVEEGLEALLTSIDQAHFTGEDIEKTKAAIYQEIRLKRDNKFAQLNDAVNDCVFHCIPYHNILGSLKRIETISLEEVEKCYNGFYRPSNQMLFLVGNFDEKKMVSLVEKIFSQFTFSNVSCIPYPYQESSLVHKSSEKVFAQTYDVYVRIAFKVDISSFSPMDRLDLDFCSSSFFQTNFGVTSALYQEFLKSNMIYDCFDFDTMFVDQYCIFYFGNYVYGDVDEFVSRVIDVVQNPVYDRKIHDLYNNHSRMNIAVRPENLGSMLDPFVDNLILFDYSDVDRVEDADRRTFERMKDLMERCYFDSYVVCQMVPETDLEK